MLVQGKQIAEKYQKVVDDGDPVPDEFLEPFREAIEKSIQVKEVQRSITLPERTKRWFEPILINDRVKLDVSRCDWIPTLVQGTMSLPNCWFDWEAWLELYGLFDLDGDGLQGKINVVTYGISINQRG